MPVSISTQRPISFSTGFKDVWDRPTIKSKLKALATARSDMWIHIDLNVTSSNSISRCFWSLVAKHFDCLRSLYFINPSLSANRLSDLGDTIVRHRDDKLYSLFLKAASNFSIITKHPVAIPERYYGSQAPTRIVVETESTPLQVQEPYLPRTETPEVIYVPPEVVSQPTRVENIVIHEHHHHVPHVIDHGIRPTPRVFPSHSPGYVAPCLGKPQQPSRVPLPVDAGHEIPGAGRRESVRNAAAALASQNIHLTSQPTLTENNVQRVPVVPQQAAKRIRQPDPQRDSRYAPPPARGNQNVQTSAPGGRIPVGTR